MRHLRHWPPTVSAVIGWGVVLTALLIGVATAATMDKRAYFPALGVGVGASLFKLLWRWPHGPYRQQILDRLSGPLFPYLFALAGCLFLLALGGWVIVMDYVQAGPHPCICFPSQQGADWINLILGGGPGAAFVILSLFGLYLSIYRMIHWRGVPFRDSR